MPIWACPGMGQMYWYVPPEPDWKVKVRAPWPLAVGSACPSHWTATG